MKLFGIFLMRLQHLKLLPTTQQNEPATLNALADFTKAKTKMMNAFSKLYFWRILHISNSFINFFLFNFIVLKTYKFIILQNNIARFHVYSFWPHISNKLHHYRYLFICTYDVDHFTNLGQFDFFYLLCSMCAC